MLSENQERIICDYLSDNLDGEGRENLDRWLEESVRNREAFKEYCREYCRIRMGACPLDVSPEKSYLLLRKRLKRGSRTILLKIAAAVVLLAGLAGGYLYTDPWGKETVAPYASGECIPRGGERPYLSMEGGNCIELGMGVGKIQSGPGMDIRLSDTNTLVYAGVPDTTGKPAVFHTLHVPKGCDFQLKLSDGTRVSLNAGSSLRYPEIFGKGSREVWLAGEAYFDVRTDSTSHFKVHTAGMDLEVLGTAFNVKAYEGDNRLITTLVRGRIGQEWPLLGKKVILTPSFQSVYDREDGSLTTVKADLKEALAWLEGEIVERNRPLGDIMAGLERWYDFEVVYADPALKDMRFHLHTRRSDNIRKVMDVLQATGGIKVSYVGKKIFIKE